MADELVARVTGLSRPEDVDIEIQLLMTDTALLAESADAAWLDGHPVPGSIARQLALAAPDPGPAGRARRWVRRLYTDPVSGTLRDVDERRRAFTVIDRRFVEIAQLHSCITPWCDASIRHLHHIDRYADGGPTVRDNAAGTCERFNYTLEMPGWGTDALADGTLRIATPAGRTYEVRPPPLRSGPRLAIAEDMAQDT